MRSRRPTQRCHVYQASMSSRNLRKGNYAANFGGDSFTTPVRPGSPGRTPTRTPKMQGAFGVVPNIKVKDHRGVVVRRAVRLRQGRQMANDFGMHVEHPCC